MRCVFVLRSVYALTAVGSLVALPVAIRAQTADTSKGETVVQGHLPLFTNRDLYTAGGFVAATVLLTPFDQRLAEWLQKSPNQQERFLHHAATGIEYISSPGAYLIGGGLYLVGRLTGIRPMADLGLHGTEGVIAGDLVTVAIKDLAGRARPFVVADTSPRDFGF